MGIHILENWNDWKLDVTIAKKIKEQRWNSPRIIQTAREYNSYQRIFYYSSRRIRVLFLIVLYASCLYI